MPRIPAGEKMPPTMPIVPVEFEMRLKGLLEQHRKFPGNGEVGRADELVYLALARTEFAAGAEVWWEMLHGQARAR